MELRDRIVLITGASQGIGAATARAFGALGAEVWLVARGAEALAAVAADVEAAGGRARVFPCDLSDLDAIAAFAAAAPGVPDVIINNAGAGRWLAVEETAPVEARAMMALPYLAAFAVTAAFLPAMIARGAGWVLSVNSPACLIPIPGATGYSASRAALRTFTRGLAREVRGTGVGVTHLVVGKVDSTYFANNPGAEARIPSLDRLMPTLTCAQVADAIVRCVARQRRGEVVIPLMMRLFYWQFLVAPWSVEQLLWATGWRRAG